MAEVPRQAADRARSFGSSLDGRGRRLLDDLRGLARRRPGMFLLGALSAGVVAGWLARGAASSTSSDLDPSVRPGVRHGGASCDGEPATYPAVDPLASSMPAESEPPRAGVPGRSR